MGLKTFVDNKNSILNLAIILLSFMISYNAIYKKQVKEEGVLKQKINEEAKKNEVLKNISNKEKTLKAYNNLIPRKDANLIINTLTNIARASGVKITSIKPGQEQRNPDYIKTPFKLTIAAPGYNALGKFIGEIENYRDIYMAVETLNIMFGGEARELSVNLKVSSIANTD
jgi:Tfp pilus assembly protein PilO